MTHLLDLPHDALLAVLAYVRPRQLFTCRAACRRLRDLCLDRNLWRHVSLEYEDLNLVPAVLALAPCVKSITCIGPSDVQASLVKTTTCVVTMLELRIYPSSRMGQAIEVIQRLYALGGLRRELCLTITIDNHRCRSIKPLLRAVYDLRGLKTLQLETDGVYQLMAAAWCETWCDLEAEPSLSDLVFSSRTAYPFLQLLLRTHAPTLQKVRLGVHDHVPVSLLLKIPGLRSLKCSLNADLSPLVALPSLHTIELFDAVGCHRGSLEFLRASSHLRCVRLWDCTDTVLLALSESRSARHIEQLVFMFRKHLDLKVLSLALPKFHALQVLDVSYDFRDFLYTVMQVVCKVSTPSLTTLVVYPFVPGNCLHQWLHRRDVQELLLMNPRLHLRVRGQNRLRCNWCWWCAKGCHELLRCPGPRSFSSHSKAAGCPADCYNITD